MRILSKTRKAEIVSWPFSASFSRTDKSASYIVFSTSFFFICFVKIVGTKKESSEHRTAAAASNGLYTSMMLSDKTVENPMPANVHMGDEKLAVSVSTSLFMMEMYSAVSWSWKSAVPLRIIPSYKSLRSSSVNLALNRFSVNAFK